jgi:hypothetical protein
MIRLHRRTGLTFAPAWGLSFSSKVVSTRSNALSVENDIRSDMVLASLFFIALLLLDLARASPLSRHILPHVFPVMVKASVQLHIEVK